MSRNKSIILFVLLIITLLLAIISVKSNFENIDFFRVKNDAMDENLYIEIEDSKDINFIKAKSKKIVEQKIKYRHNSTDTFANQFEYLLLQIFILLICLLILFIGFFKRKQS